MSNVDIPHLPEEEEVDDLEPWPEPSPEPEKPPSHAPVPDAS